jgi:hypothetical protein
LPPGHPPPSEKAGRRLQPVSPSSRQQERLSNERPLAAVGLYGVTFLGVMQRIPEVGVRMALGASPRDVVRLILKEGLTKTAIGLGVGLALGWGLGKALESFLFQVRPEDPVTFSAVPLFFLAAAAPGPRGRAAAGHHLSACWFQGELRGKPVGPIEASLLAQTMSGVVPLDELRLAGRIVELHCPRLRDARIAGAELKEEG